MEVAAGESVYESRTLITQVKRKVENSRSKSNKENLGKFLWQKNMSFHVLCVLLYVFIRLSQWGLLVVCRPLVMLIFQCSVILPWLILVSNPCVYRCVLITYDRIAYSS